MKRIALLTLAVTLAAAAIPAYGATLNSHPRVRLGAIWQLQNDAYLLLVRPAHRRFPHGPQNFGPGPHGVVLVERFTVPEHVQLRSGVFRTRGELEQYLLRQYLTPLIPTTIPPELPPSPPPCELSDAGSVRCQTFDGPPRIFIVLPTSGSPLTPVLIGGSGFAAGAVPFFGTPPGSLTPGVTLLTVSLQNFPLLGTVSATVTFVPPGTPLESSAVQLEYLGQRSNPFPFEVR